MRYLRGGKYISIKRVSYDVRRVERCPKCNKRFIVAEWGGQYVPFSECPRCDPGERRQRALKRRTTWLRSSGSKMEPVVFPPSISKILYGP